MRKIKSENDILRLGKTVNTFLIDTFFSSGASRILYKAVFHGGMKSMWGSLMEEPIFRGVNRCVNSHDVCVEQKAIEEEFRMYSFG